MYERSAIVLERYLSNLLGYFSENNLKVNFQNYCNLIEKLDIYQDCFEKQEEAILQFQDVTDRLKAIQKNQERLYKKSAKLEYNRNILFNNIEDKTENLEKCLQKIENDSERTGEHLKELRIDFIDTLNKYNKNSNILAKSKKARKVSEQEFLEIFEESQENVDNINEFVLEFARNFNGKEIKEKLFKLMIDNGKEEKIPFDEDVIKYATNLGIDIAQKEVACYIDAYDSINKLFDEIEDSEVKIDKYKRKVRNIKVILNFLQAQKEYLVQFLDYERMTSVNGKRIHKKLMIQACENFELDIKQINNLYELILKEIENKTNQKIYKELYNKSYLVEIDRADAALRKEKNKVNSAVATVLGSNYWRIEGIKNIYTVFYRDISEVFGRYLDEFDVPIDEDLEIELNEEVENLKATFKAQKNIKVSNEVEEDELPILMFDEEEIGNGDGSLFQKSEELEPEVKELKKDTKKIENKQEEPKEIRIVEEIEEIKPKRRRKDIIKEEEEAKKKEKAKVAEVKEETKEIKQKRRRKDIIKEEEEAKKKEKTKVAEIKEEAEEVKPKRRRKDIIKEEEEAKKKEKTKSVKIKEEEPKKRQTKIQRIEELEEVLVEEEIKEEKYLNYEEFDMDTSFIDEQIKEIEDIDDLEDMDIEDFEEEEEESLFGNIKNVRNSKRTNIDLAMLEQLEEKNKTNKKGLFGSLRNMNNKKGKRVAD